MVLNETYTPTGKYEDEILEILEAEHRLTPTDIAEAVGSNRSAINHNLHRLTAAGWVDKPHGRGLYEFVTDPRKVSDEGVAVIHLERALELLGVDADAHAVVEQLR